MKSPDRSLHETSNVQVEVRQTFEKIWRELQGRESAAPNSDLSRNKLWLECNGELTDTASVKSLWIRTPVSGAELVTFVCPRCDQSHESIRFR